jgi:hypothetical protein
MIRTLMIAAASAALNRPFGNRRKPQRAEATAV